MSVVPQRRAELVNPVTTAHAAMDDIASKRRLREQHSVRLDRLQCGLAGAVQQAESIVSASKLLKGTASYLAQRAVPTSTPAAEPPSPSPSPQDFTHMLQHCMRLEAASSALALAEGEGDAPRPPLVHSLRSKLESQEAATFALLQGHLDSTIQGSLGEGDSERVGQLLRCHVAIRCLPAFEAAVVKRISRPALRAEMLALPVPSVQDAAAIAQYFLSWQEVLTRVLGGGFSQLCEYAACLPFEWSPVMACLWQPLAQMLLEGGLREEWQRPARTSLFRVAHLGVHALWNTLLQAEMELTGTSAQVAAGVATDPSTPGGKLFAVFKSGTPTWFSVVLNELVAAATHDLKTDDGSSSQCDRLVQQLTSSVGALLSLPAPESWTSALCPGIQAVGSAAWSVLGNCATVGRTRQRAPQAMKQLFLSAAGTLTPNTKAEELGLGPGLAALLQAHSSLQQLQAAAAKLLHSAESFAASCCPPRPPALTLQSWEHQCSDVQRSLQSRSSALLQRAGLHTGRHLGALFSGVRRAMSKVGAGSVDMHAYVATCPGLLGGGLGDVRGAIAEAPLARGPSADPTVDAAAVKFCECAVASFCAELAAVCAACLQAARSLQGGQLAWLQEGGAGQDAASAREALSPQDRVVAALEAECAEAVRLLLEACGSPADISPSQAPGWHSIEAALKNTD